MEKKTFAVVLALTLAAVGPAGGQAPPDAPLLERIREVGFERSEIELRAHELVEVIGPRLSGSSGMRRAREWAASRLRSWGLSDVTADDWYPFGRRWEPGPTEATVLEPFVRTLHALPVAWTAGTEGPVEAPVVAIPVGGTDVTGASMPDPGALEELADRLDGAVALLGSTVVVGLDSAAPELRWSADEILPARPFDYDRAPSNPEAALALIDSLIASIETQHAARDSLFRAYGVVAIMSPSGRANGILRASASWAGINPRNPEPIPELVVAAEQFNEMKRNLEAGVSVRVALDIGSRFGEVVSEANVLADLPGIERPSEVVMIGAHLDSWHLGGGATDNGAGSIVLMEAMRILRAVGARPRRTIRIALWSGEEQGLYGSRAWVARHAERRDRVIAYLNLDNGTGRVRAIRSEGRGERIRQLDEILLSVKDLGVLGVVEASSGGSDHLPLQAAGIPAYTFLQDPIEYDRRTHHSSLDTFDHLVLEDLKQAAVVVAWLAYRLAAE